VVASSLAKHFVRKKAKNPTMMMIPMKKRKSKHRSSSSLLCEVVGSNLVALESTCVRKFEQTTLRLLVWKGRPLRFFTICACLFYVRVKNHS